MAFRALELCKVVRRDLPREGEFLATSAQVGPERLEAVAACPVCRTALAWEAARVRCPTCARGYPRSTTGAPILLIEGGPVLEAAWYPGALGVLPSSLRGSRGGTSGGSPRSWRTDRRTAASARAQPDGHGDEWTEHQHRRARSKAERQHRAHRSKLAKCVPVTEWLAESIAGDRVKGSATRESAARPAARARDPPVSAPADPPARQRTGYSR